MATFTISWTINESDLPDAFKFVKENMTCQVLSYKGKVFGLNCPNFVELEVTHTEPGLAGNTATNTLKPATVETGAEVRVPLFINDTDKTKTRKREREDPNMKLSEKVAYLKGLEEGLNLDSGKSESKLIKGILEAFDEIVNAIDQNAADLKEMTDRVDEIDMDLGDLEAILFEGFEVEELTEDEFDELDADEDEAFEVYTTDEAPAEEAPAEEEAADELFAEAPAEEVVEEVVEEAPVEEVVEEVVEEEEELDDDAIFAAADEVVAEAEAAEAAAAEETSVFEEVAAPAAAAAASGIAWPDEEPEVGEEAPVEEVEEVVEREAEPEEDTYEVECTSCSSMTASLHRAASNARSATRNSSSKSNTRTDGTSPKEHNQRGTGAVGAPFFQRSLIMETKEKTIRKVYVFRGRILTVRNDDALMTGPSCSSSSSGTPTWRTCSRRPPASSNRGRTPSRPRGAS